MKINGSIIADVSIIMIIQDFQYRLMQKKCTKVMKDFLEEHEHEIYLTVSLVTSVVQ